MYRFSYGDVFGAGKGWAKSILLNNFLRDEFQKFFNDQTKFVFGVCNGCQFLCELQEILPTNQFWPKFLPNKSKRFEARQSLVEVLDSESIFFKDMLGLKLPIIISHGHGRADFEDITNEKNFVNPIIKYIDHLGATADTYPHNPNGSPNGLTGFTSSDGRICAMMPHPERCFRNIQFSWLPNKIYNYGDYSPWIQIFRNAFLWINNK